MFTYAAQRLTVLVGALLVSAIAVSAAVPVLPVA